MEQVTEAQDILRGNPIFIKLVVQYTRYLLLHFFILYYFTISILNLPLKFQFF